MALKMFINHTSKQVTAKIVYYGTGLSGKTTNLQYIYSITNPKSRGELISMETDIERTLFFDLLPIDVGSINGYQTKFQLYTVPGQIFYDSTRKIVLKGVDGIVFVGDSQELMIQGNIDSFENLKSNLLEQNVDIKKIPLVIQYNKRDLKKILSVKAMNKAINQLNSPYFEAVAINGDGVIETLKSISTLTLAKIKKEIDSSSETPNGSTQKISFDTDKSNKIMSIQEIPQKKINIDDMDNPELQIDIEPESKDLKRPKIDNDISKTQKIAIPLKKEKTIEDIENGLKRPKENKSNNKISKANLLSKDSLKILNDLNDNTRQTIIKKIKFKNSENIIEIKDTESNILDSFKLKISPETKKITIIIDVKK